LDTLRGAGHTETSAGQCLVLISMINRETRERHNINTIHCWVLLIDSKTAAVYPPPEEAAWVVTRGRWRTLDTLGDRLMQKIFTAEHLSKVNLSTRLNTFSCLRYCKDLGVLKCVPGVDFDDL